jgi:hypothetical protein
MQVRCCTLDVLHEMQMTSDMLHGDKIYVNVQMINDMLYLMLSLTSMI